MRRAFALLTLVVSVAVFGFDTVRAQSAPKMPDANGVTILVRTTLIALDQANRTGNYTVLRDLGSPGFRRANTAAKLAAIFGNLRRKNLDLGPVAVVGPIFTQKPALNAQGMLRATGYFPTKPLRVNFDLAYQRVGNRWQLFGIAASADPAPAAAAR